jgi:restriction system protein
VQGFAGALQGQRARKGVMITTSDYTNDARAYVASLSTRIVLINGERLAEMMIDHNVGVSTEQTYAIKKLDSDYFED